VYYIVCDSTKDENFILPWTTAYIVFNTCTGTEEQQQNVAEHQICREEQKHSYHIKHSKSLKTFDQFKIEPQIPNQDDKWVTKNWNYATLSISIYKRTRDKRTMNNWLYSVQTYHY